MNITKDLRLGDLVWAKMKGFPFWPAKVIEPEKPPSTKKYHHHVYFYGTKDHAWILDELIVHHSQAMVDTCESKKLTPNLRAAVEEIKEAAKDFVPREEPAPIQMLTLKYKKMKESKKVAKKRIFGMKRLHLKKPKAVITPYDDELNALESYAWNVPHLPPTEKKIGFLGLGFMGQCLVERLLNSRHKVTVWNRTPEKCDGLVRKGALRGSSVADVVAACDITFCCVSEPEVVKSLVFGAQGVLAGLEQGRSTGKGYVELTGVDELTSKEIAEAVTFNGGRYLEAALSGSCSQTEKGRLVVYASGDTGLFQECETVFHSISAHALHINEEVGYGCTLNLLVNMLSGTVCAALGEAMALADRIGVSKRNFLEVLVLSGFNCQLFCEKGMAMIERNNSMTVSVKNQQKDLHLALQHSHARQQYMPVVSAANELYKHAKRLGNTKRDSSSVFLATKF